MGVSAGHASPENQPPRGGHSEPWGWGSSVSPPGSLSSPRQECFHVLELEGLGWEKKSGTVVEPVPQASRPQSCPDLLPSCRFPVLLDRTRARA